MSTPAPSESVAESIVNESRQKRRRIAASLWPRARLIGEILYHQIDRDRLFTQASALTYKTLFSLLPIFVLSLLVLSTISAGDGKNALDNVVINTFYEKLEANKLTIPEDASSSTQPATLVASTEPGESKTQPARVLSIRDFFDPILQRAKASVTNRATGLVAFAVLLYGAISLMIVVESTFNLIYGAVKPRSWPRRIMLYWCVLTLGPIGVAASIVLGRSAYSTATTYAGAGWFLSTINVLTGFVVSWLLILLMYRVIPETRVNWRPAAIASFLAALSWEIGKWAFGLYVERAARYNVYGSLALLPLFMMWIYVSWSVLLLGLELCYVQQYWPMLKRRFFFTRGGKGLVPLSDLRWVLSLGVLLYKRFELGQTTQVHQAAELLMLPNDVTGELMIALETAGLVHNIRDGAYTLARPPDAITAFDLLSAAQAMCQVPPELSRDSSRGRAFPDPPALRELQDLETTWAKNHALPQLAG